MKRKTIITILILIICVTISNICYADPNSSKGYAEYTQEQAEQEAQEALQKQEEELEQSEEKSRNNYLETLEIQGYKLTPEFDKQTIEYTINEQITTNELEIKATPSDEKAKIEGIGKIKIDENTKQLNIDVTAESGTVRTYTIYLNNQYKEEAEQKAENVEQYIEPENTTNEETQKSTTNKGIIAIIVLILAIIISIILTIKKRRKK